MTTGRRLALKILDTVVRFASPGAQDWAKAILREMDFIENDWTALLWALGSAGYFSGAGMLLWPNSATFRGRRGGFRSRFLGEICVSMRPVHS